MDASSDVRAVFASIGYEDVGDGTPPLGAILGFYLVYLSLSTFRLGW